jgi:hypothetical protein
MEVRGGRLGARLRWSSTIICAIHPYMRAKLRVYRPGAEELARR